MIELADDPAASANQDLWGIGRGLAGEQIRHLCEASAGVPQIDGLPAQGVSHGNEVSDNGTAPVLGLGQVVLKVVDPVTELLVPTANHGS